MSSIPSNRYILKTNSLIFMKNLSLRSTTEKLIHFLESIFEVIFIYEKYYLSHIEKDEGGVWNCFYMR